MSNNNYTLSALAMTNEFCAAIDEYLAAISTADDELAGVHDQVEDMRYVLRDLRDAIGNTQTTIGLLRYALQPGELRSRTDGPDPWATPVTRRSLRRLARR